MFLLTRPPRRRARSVLGLGAATPVVALCWLAVFFDGLDVTIYGAALPYLLDDQGFGLDATMAGSIGSWTTFGMLVGALGAGNTTDWLGRRRVLTFCVLVFSAGSGACALAEGPMSFAVARFVAGLGLGGLIPICLATVAEFASSRKLAFATGVLMTAYHAGGMAATGLGLALAPTVGWRWVFAVGALPAVLIAPLLLRRLPESPAVLDAKGRTELARRTRERYELPPPRTGEIPTDGAAERLRAARDLFAPGRRWLTPLLWAASSCGLMLVYGVSTWLPELMRSSGYGLTSSVSLLLVINAGGMVGMLIAGRVADRFGPAPVAALWFTLTAASMLLFAAGPPLAVTYVVAALAGVWLFSASTMVYAAASRFYPASLRAPGIGWVAGIGRLGAVVSPWLGGVLISRQAEEWGFIVFALAGLGGALAIVLASRDVGTRTTG